MKCPCGGPLEPSEHSGYERCAVCGSHVSEPAPPSLYTDDYWARHGGIKAHGDLIFRDRFPWWFERVMRAKPKRLLEIGCAPGVLMDHVYSEGVDTRGIDPSFDHDLTLKGFWPETRWPGRFDTIVALDVLEHVPDPNAAVRAMRESMIPGGTLLLQIPTIRDGAPFEERFFLPGEHVWIPTQRALNELLARNGFEVTRCDEVWHPGHEWTEAKAVGGAESWKARPRRERERFFERYMQGSGVDVGCGFDPVTDDCVRWEIERGPLQGLYDWVYSSHCLEHVDDPIIELRRWAACLKPGGRLIVSVPHRELYEGRKTKPSRWNEDHRTFWLPDRSEEPCTLSLIDTFRLACPELEVLLMSVDDEGWEPVPPDVHPHGEYQVTLVARKPCALS